MLALLLAAVCGASSAACGSSKPNVLLVVFDTTRRDHCSVYGYPRDTTPNLVELAAEGARFDAAYAPTATTGPTHASVFTGLFPPLHGVLKNGFFLGGEQRTLAEALRAAGYQTAAVVSSFVLDSKFGYAQGFMRYDDDFERRESAYRMEFFAGQPVGAGFDRPADTTTRLALQALGDFELDSRRPFFLFVHYFDPHEPYLPPPAFASRFPTTHRARSRRFETIRAYDAEIAFADHELGRLLDGLDERGIAEDTLVVVTADHGEGLMQRGRMGHGIHIYEEAVRVPLLARWPGRIESGRALAEPVSLVDLPAAILSLARAEVDWPAAAAPGRRLTALLTGAGPDRAGPARPVFVYRRHYSGGKVEPEGIWAAGEKFGVRLGSWKYIEGPAEGTRELFDLATDPGETTNLQGLRPRKAALLAKKVSDWRETLTRAAPAGSISPEDRSLLEQLGYAE